MWSTPQPRGQVNLTPSTFPQLATTPLCMTPCRVNLPLGTHEVLFADLLPGSPRSSSAFVRVGPRPSVVRHALGAQEAYPGRLVGGIVLVGLGTAGVLAGAMLASFGEVESAGPEPLDLGPAGFATLGVGAALTTAGALLLGWSRPTVRPGATTQWTP